MTFVDSLDTTCPTCDATLTLRDATPHVCRGERYSISEEVVGYIRRPIRQARPANEIDWPELIFTFIVALIGVAAFVSMAFALLPGYPL